MGRGINARNTWKIKPARNGRGRCVYLGRGEVLRLACGLTAEVSVRRVEVSLRLPEDPCHEVVARSRAGAVAHLVHVAALVVEELGGLLLGPPDLDITVLIRPVATRPKRVCAVARARVVVVRVPVRKYVVRAGGGGLRHAVARLAGVGGGVGLSHMVVLVDSVGLVECRQSGDGHGLLVHERVLGPTGHVVGPEHERLGALGVEQGLEERRVSLDLCQAWWARKERA